jgi:hypothetical protein
MFGAGLSLQFLMIKADCVDFSLQSPKAALEASTSGRAWPAGRLSAFVIGSWDGLAQRGCKLVLACSRIQASHGKELT